MIQDLRIGIRILLKGKMLTLAAIFSLGLGIGTTSTIYALIDQILINDITARELDELVIFGSRWTSYPNYRDVRDSGVFKELATHVQCGPAPRWRVGDQTHAVIADCVSANFFEFLGVQAARGRVFTDDEAAAEKHPRVVVISHHFWQRRLSADPNIIGRDLTLNNTVFTVIGVLPANYRPIPGRGYRPDIFVPINTALYPDLFNRAMARMNFVGRLAPGRTPLQTQQALMTVVRGLEQQYTDQIKLQNAPPPELMPVKQPIEFGDKSLVTTFSLVLSAVAALVLLIACANVAGLLLARGVARQREIAIRLAIGATRMRLIRQFLVETALIAAAGTAAGIGFTFYAATLLRHNPLPGDIIEFEFYPDWRFACGVAALGVIATLLSGLVPALTSSRTKLYNALRVSQSVTPSLRLRSLLVIAQIALSVNLLFGAFVFVRNLIHVLRFDPGFDATRILWFQLSTSDRQIYPVALREKVYRELEAQPGVEAVSWAWYLPFNFSYGEMRIRRSDAADSEPFTVTAQGIGPGYLKAMRIPLLAGREFGWRDVENLDKPLPRPMIINQAFAQKYFQGRNPVGQILVGGVAGRSEQREIVGVSANTSFVNSVGERPTPLAQPLSNLSNSFVVRVAGRPAVAAPELAKLIERLVPGVGAGYLTGPERLESAIHPARMTAALLGALAIMGLILALVGLSGISIHNVTQRTPEIGIRMGLGATQTNVLWLMMRESLKLAAAGAVIGIACTLAIARFLGRFLAADISPLDTLAFVATLTTLLVTIAISVYFPCRRATRINPMIALRHE